MNTNQQLRQIADRIKYLRDILEISAEDISKQTGISTELFYQYENCKKDIPISFIYSVAAVLHIDPTELLIGEQPRMKEYAVTRNGQGVGIERYKGYAFESLAYNFIGRDKEPMLVSISPSDKKPQLVTHGGQEFNYVLEGTVGVVIGPKTLILNKGDSVYFDPQAPHGQFAIGGDAKFLTVIDKE